MFQYCVCHLVYQCFIQNFKVFVMWSVFIILCLNKNSHNWNKFYYSSDVIHQLKHYFVTNSNHISLRMDLVYQPKSNITRSLFQIHPISEEKESKAENRQSDIYKVNGVDAHGKLCWIKCCFIFYFIFQTSGMFVCPVSSFCIPFCFLHFQVCWALCMFWTMLGSFQSVKLFSLWFRTESRRWENNSWYIFFKSRIIHILLLTFINNIDPPPPPKKIFFF